MPEPLSRGFQQHQNRFDLSSALQQQPLFAAKQAVDKPSPSPIRRKRIPDGKVLLECPRGRYHETLRAGDWAIIDKGQIRIYAEIKQVNAKTLIIEQEFIVNGRLTTQLVKIKQIAGAICLPSPDEPSGGSTSDGRTENAPPNP